MKPLIHVDRIIGKSKHCTRKVQISWILLHESSFSTVEWPFKDNWSELSCPAEEYLSRTARSKILQTNKSAKLEKTVGLATRNYMEKQFGNLSMDLVKKKRRKKEEEQFYVCCFSGWFISKIQIWGNCNIHVSCNKTYLYNL